MKRLGRNNAIDHIRLSNNGIVILPTLGTSKLHCVLPTRDGIINPWLRNTVVYDVKIVARTVAGSETLRARTVVGPATFGSLVDTVLDTQNQTITFTFTGVASTSTVGIALANASVTPTDNIIIESVSFELAEVA